MRIRQLEAFRATIITGTMSAAADSLNTSQPTVSRLIADLEYSLQIQLFQREKGRVNPTFEGLEFYHRVDKVFGAFTNLKTAAEDLRKDSFRNIRIISPPAISTAIVPEVMARLVKRWPEIHTKLLTVDNNSYFNANCETEFDVVLGNRIGFEGNMEQIQLAQVDFVCALPAGHPLADKKRVKVTDLEGETIISILDDEHRLFLKHERLYQESGVEVIRNIFTHSSGGAYAMVQRGMGIALLEPFSAPMWEKCGVITKPFIPRLTYDFVAGIKSGSRQSSAVRTIINIAKEVFQEFQFNGS